MNIKFTGSVILLTLIAACGNKEKKESDAFIRPVKVATVESRSEVTKNFSGVVEAVNFVKLAFRVSGQIINLPVVEGQRVEKGQLIAEIDPREILLQYSADLAAYENARSQLDRNKRLLSKQAISQQEYEISEAKYQQAKSAYELSQNNLRDAKLYAPFSGSIEQRMVENYQRVSSGVPIVKLIDTRQLQIKFVAADSYLHLLQAPDKKLSVEFETYRGHRFKASLLEYLDASPDGSGIPVTIIIDDPQFDRSVYDVKPGFACNIDFYARVNHSDLDQMTQIPLSAVFADKEDSKEYVWVVDKDDRVHRREVVIYTPFGNSNVWVKDGLKAGERVVSAGVYQIVEDEKIKVIP